MQNVINFIRSAWDYLFYLIESSFLTLVDILKDFFLWAFDQVLGLATSLLSEADPFINWNPATYFEDLPLEITNILGLVGLGTCTQIIITSLLIRFILQAIPFIRWGS